jgi:1,4-alpha-glucan branching enzyme
MRLVSLVLHAHLPYVRHPEHPTFLEEDWLFEAITETYLPILDVLDRLEGEGISFTLTMSLTPPLCEMLADPLLRERYARHLGRLVELSEKEVAAKAGTPFEDASRMYREIFRRSQNAYETRYGRDLLAAFRRHADGGRLEILTCGATHGFLPLMREPEAVRAQIAVAVANYEKHFGRRPRGIWLPECGYAAGIERVLAAEGIRFFFTDTHGLTGATPRPSRGVYEPCATPAGPVVFARDPESSKEVWSAAEGYPGDPLYREFYRDLGYDAPYDYIAPYLHPDGVRRNIGIKYHRVTGRVDLRDKEPYVPAWAADRAIAHAADFLAKRRVQLDRINAGHTRPGLIVSPYDAELYGHWWFEGPQFLEHVIRGAAGAGLSLISPWQYLERCGAGIQVVEPNASTWGNGGYNATWLNDETLWMYFHQHACETQMVELATRLRDPGGTERRALNQAARELLLAQSSDWAFIITNGTVTPYAVKRFRTHVQRFLKIMGEVGAGRVDEEALAACEAADNIFGEIDYRVYAREG